MIEIYTDGASQGNPGPSGAGVYIKADGEHLEYAVQLDEMSNHEAEFHAVIEALKICHTQFPEEILSFRSDSQIVVQALNQNYVKNEQFQPLLKEIQILAEPFPYFFMKWIPQKENLHADRLAKEAIHMT